MKQRNIETGPEFSDAIIRRFLLAQLAADQQAAFERALFTNPELEQRVRLAETGLTDDYACGQLNPKQRELFEQNFLVSTSRRNALEVSNALREQFGEVSASHPRTSVADKFQALFAVRHPAWRFAFAAAILIVLLAMTWLVTKEPQFVQRIIPRRARPSAVSTPTPEVAHHAADSASSPTHHDEPSQSPAHEVGVQTVVMRPQNTGETAVVNLSQTATSIVRFDLIVESPLQSGCRADIMTRDGEVVYAAEQIFVTAGANRISFDAPANKLKTGEFQIKLTHISDGTVIAVYDFRVQ
jgi:hypothetical protein